MLPGACPKRLRGANKVGPRATCGPRFLWRIGCAGCEYLAVLFKLHHSVFDIADDLVAFSGALLLYSLKFLIKISSGASDNLVYLALRFFVGSFHVFFVHD